MHIPGLGTVTEDPELGWYVSEPIPIAMLDGKPCRVMLDEYEDDPDREQIDAVIRGFLAADPSVLRAAEPYLFAYYRDCRRNGVTGLDLRSPRDVWRHVQLGDEPAIGRDGDDPRHVYVSLEGECDWEPEHGLQIVLENGVRVCKVGPFDGHMTNASAYGDERLRDVVYQGSDAASGGGAPPGGKQPWWKLW
ncbi:MAG TPA: hypothetical protein VFQ45_16245 [Longimicrobium sp.]|nr:hypothetical protein [Longimicrobium sp.]